MEYLFRCISKASTLNNAIEVNRLKQVKIASGTSLQAIVVFIELTQVDYFADHTLQLAK